MHPAMIVLRYPHLSMSEVIMSESEKGASTKSPRYFFSNPVHAISAMLDHGIKIIGHNPQNIADWMSRIACEDWDGRPWYIADESLRLLEPRAGDYVIEEFGTLMKVVRIDEPLQGRTMRLMRMALRPPDPRSSNATANRFSGRSGRRYNYSELRRPTTTWPATVTIPIPIASIASELPSGTDRIATVPPKKVSAPTSAVATVVVAPVPVSIVTMVLSPVIP